MFSDHDIFDENKSVLLRRFRLLHEPREVDLALLGLTPDAAEEITGLTDNQILRAADAAAPLFSFALEDQILRAITDPQAIPIAKPNRVEAEVQEDALLMLTNRWISSRHSPSFAATVLGLSRALIDAFASATYLDICRVAAVGVRPRLCVKPHYIFHAARNLTMHTGQRTNLAVCNSRYYSF